MKVVVVNHPLVTHKLTVLRDKQTNSQIFRHLVEELVTLLAYEATRDVKIQEVSIETPVTQTKGAMLATPRPVVVPILRAGLGMLEGMMRVIPSADVGFLGMVRDEKTLQASTYANRLPDDLTKRQCYVLDPMLATGSSLELSYGAMLTKGRPEEIHVACIIASKQALEYIQNVFPEEKTTIWCAAIDPEIDSHSYIIPGLGDAGDLAYGEKE